MTLWLTLLLAVTVGAVGDESSPGTYIITFAKKIAPGWTVPIRVQILNATQPVSIQIALVNRTSDTIIRSTTRSFAQDQPETVDFQIPKDLNRPWGWNELQFNFTGTGGLKFRSSETCEFNEKSKSIFIQTDKAMYKPGQQVKFRVVAVYPDLKVVREPMDIVIYDSSKNRIKQWRGATDPSGVVSRVLAMSSDPVPGDWKIEVTLDRYKETKIFTIAEYVLPKFEVETILPSYITLNMTSVSGSVTAKYTHGKGVDGTANIHIRFFYYYGNSKKNPFIRKRVQVVDGKGDFDFSLDELRVLAVEGDTYPTKSVLAADTNLKYRSIIVEANVTETLTEKTLSAKQIRKTIYENSYKLNFIDVCPDVFKPGLTYLCGLQVSQRDDRLVSPQALEEVNVTITYQVLLPTTPAPPTTTTTTTTRPKPKPDMVLEGNGTTVSGRPLPPITMVDPDFRRPGPGYYPRYKTVVLSSNMVSFNPKTGLVEVKANIPTDAESINLQADGFNTHANRYASKSHSPSESYIQLTVPNAQTRVGDNMEFQLRSTTPISDFTYQVLSRGRIVAVQDVSVPSPSSSNVFAIRMTAEMAPNPQIVVYFQHDDGEIVADAISIKVDGTFDNNVRVEFDQRSVKPGAAVNVKVHADPDSLVFLLGRDKSVLLLKDGNDITEEMVSRELMTYDYGSYFGWFDSWFRGCWLPRSSGGTDAKGVFSGANLAVVTDANVYEHRDNFYDDRFRFAVDSPMSAGGLGGAGVQSKAVAEQANFQSVERTRTNFPETWIWDMVVIGTSGHRDLSLQAPDTITTWITSAFAVNPGTGLAVATRTANLTTERKLFLRLELPYSVVRGEEFVLQATAFNYHERDLPALIILKQNTQFHNIFLSASRGQEKDIYSTQQSHSIDIPAGKGRAVYFVIKPMVVGDVILEVDLLSWESGDGVRRLLRVEPEGLERTENVAMLIDLRESLTFQESTSIDFPVQTVEGSQKLRVSVAGDILGPSLTNIENLVRMPGGCGEQNMVRFAPNIYVMKYLQRTQRLTTPIKDKIEMYMEKGYQRELRYKHTEGCYSTFGESATYSNGNRNCSMWLTAFVLKCFTQAYPLIPDVIDTNVLSQGLQWIVRQQDEDGSFPEDGHIFNKRMQSGTGMGVGLTAYVLIALKEAQVAQVLWPSNDEVPLDTLGGDLSRASRPAQREPASVLTDKMLLDSASKAVQYMESRLDTLNSTYDKILVAYALALADSERASEAQSIVEAAAVRDVSSVHWKDPSPPKPTGYFHYRWYHDTEAKSIEMTSYVLLLYSLTNNVTEGLPVMRWISNQRNDRGGFISTQDTVIALEALSKFAGDVYSPQTSINVSVNIQGYSKNFDVNPNTALLLQADDIPMANVPGVLTVTASGSGVAVLQVLKQYNENQPSINPKFELRVEVLEQTDRKFVLKTCFRHLEEGSSGMSILEIGVPTGFDPDLNERTHTAVFSRSERNENVLTLYFNNISDGEGCINTVMTMVDVVIDTRPSTVTLREYYEPDNVVSTLYSRMATQMCSVCPECSFRCQIKTQPVM